jgi:hypothetical protein
MGDLIIDKDLIVGTSQMNELTIKCNKELGTNYSAYK